MKPDPSSLSIQLPIRFHPSVIWRVERLAKKVNMTKSEIVRIAAELGVKYLERDENNLIPILTMYYAGTQDHPVVLWIDSVAEKLKKIESLLEAQRDQNALLERIRSCPEGRKLIASLEGPGGNQSIDTSPSVPQAGSDAPRLAGSPKTDESRRSAPSIRKTPAK